MLSIISISVFTVYLIFIFVKFGVLKSISDSYYHLNNKIWFVLALWGFAIPVIIMAESGLLFFAGASIAFVGAAAEFKQAMTKTVHYVSAVFGIALGMLSLWMDYDLGYVVICFFIAGGLVFALIKNRIFWIEVLAFYTILISLLCISIL